MLLRCRSKCVLPVRALQPVAGVNKSEPSSSSSNEEESKKIPHIPREFAKDTIEFFRQSSPHVKSLLDLVFSPVNHQEDPEMLKIKTEFEKAVEAKRSVYKKHEEKASKAMFNAIKNLPEDLYDEAVRKGHSSAVPESLLFHEMYKEQLMKEALSDSELFKMQTFANLMHIRYSHSEAKKKHRDKFFISESQALNIRKERAQKEKNINHTN